MPQHTDNPFTLVYRGALTQNEEGAVNIHPVTYTNNEGLEIVVGRCGFFGDFPQLLRFHRLACMDYRYHDRYCGID